VIPKASKVRGNGLLVEAEPLANLTNRDPGDEPTAIVEPGRQTDLLEDYPRHRTDRVLHRGGPGEYLDERLSPADDPSVRKGPARLLAEDDRILSDDWWWVGGRHAVPLAWTDPAPLRAHEGRRTCGPHSTFIPHLLPSATVRGCAAAVIEQHR
jgi:hypothetical protein